MATPAYPSAYADQPLFASDSGLRSLGRYALKHVLGASASGTICAAYDPETGREVAIHLLRTLPGRHQAQAAIAEEAERWKALVHPNLPRVLEVGSFVDPSHPSGRRVGIYLVRELLPGMDMQRWLDMLPANVDTHVIDRVLDLFIAVGRALAAAHAVGLVHRDVRPSNMMVGYDARAWLIDFASSDAVPIQPSYDEQSPRYPAPELRTGAAADARADQYSFCASLLAALTRTSGLRINRRLRNVIARGMAERPEDRWPSMDHLLRALDRNRSGLFRVVASALTGR